MFSWRWTFLVQPPLCLVAIVAVYLLLHLPKENDAHWKHNLRRIDFAGALILFCAVATLLIGLDRGSNGSWKDQITIACIVMSLVLFTGFVSWEKYVASEPFAPGHIIFERSLVAAYLCNFFSFSGWMAAIFYIPLYLQAVHGYSASRASVLLVPAIVAGVSGSLFGGMYMQHTGRYYWLTVVCYAILVLGMVGILLFSGVVVVWIPGMVMGMVVCGFCNGIGVTSSLIGLIANASREDQAIATACSYLFRSMGSVFGIAISATAVNQTLQNLLVTRLRDRSPEEAKRIADMVRSSLDALNGLEPKVRDVVRGCYETAIQVGFATDIGILLGAAISAWWIREKILKR